MNTKRMSKIRRKAKGFLVIWLRALLNKEEQAKVFVWRKHARLQEFMAKKWADQNPAVKVEGHLAHLGFNGDQEAPCYLTKEVVDELGEQIQKGFSDYHAEDGFFGVNNSKRIQLRTIKSKTSNF